MGSPVQVDLTFEFCPPKHWMGAGDNAFGAYTPENPHIYIILSEFMKAGASEEKLIEAIGETISHEYLHAAIFHAGKNKRRNFLYLKEEEIVTELHGAMKVFGEKQNNPE